MFDISTSYQYHSCGKKQAYDGDVPFLRHTLAFRSTRSKQQYLVEVDEFEDFNLFFIKFYLKNHRLSKKRFSLHSGLNEAPHCIATCLKIMLEFYEKNPYRSFGFIGAASESEAKNNTKRFQLYSRVMAARFSDIHFQHYQHKPSSVYLLLNRDYLENHPNLQQEITEYFTKNYLLILNEE